MLHSRRHVPGPSQRPPRPFSAVTTAVADDYDDLVYFLRSVRDEIGGGAVEDAMMTTLADALTKREGGIAFVIRGTRGIEASLGIKFERPWYTRQFRLESTWNLVLPDLRASTGHAKSLLVEATKFADQMGRPLILQELTPKVIDTKKAEDPKLRLCGRNLRPSGMVFSHSPGESAA